MSKKKKKNKVYLYYCRICNKEFDNGKEELDNCPKCAGRICKETFEAPADNLCIDFDIDCFKIKLKSKYKKCRAYRNDGWCPFVERRKKNKKINFEDRRKNDNSKNLQLIKEKLNDSLKKKRRIEN